MQTNLAPLFYFRRLCSCLAACRHTTLIHGPQCNDRILQLFLFLRRMAHFAALTGFLHAVPEVFTAGTLKYCLTRLILSRKIFATEDYPVSSYNISSGVTILRIITSHTTRFIVVLLAFPFNYTFKYTIIITLQLRAV